ncbi:hypothetical protein [Kribbella sp. DT2]|uniref:hypothetical protein n=1 Tax=Kribbella sp. DT2 TaxID=3393427 RepID=UPI003CF7F962
MSETDLRERLTAGVADVEAPTDLLDRVRAGGSRRLRRRQLGALATTALAAVLVAGVAITAPGVLRADRPEVAATPSRAEPYAQLTTGPTRGDLAGDRQYLSEILAAWKAYTGPTGEPVHVDLRGSEPHVAWAGRTPGGRAAIIAQRGYLAHPGDLPPRSEGTRHTMLGFFADGADGRPTLIKEAGPGIGAIGGLMVGDAAHRTLVVIDDGTPTGLSTRRDYLADGTSRHRYDPLTFKDGVSITMLPAGTDPDAVRVKQLAPGSVPLALMGTGTVDGERIPEHRLWPGKDKESWPMTAAGGDLRTAAHQVFAAATGKVRDQDAYSFATSTWAAYGVTPNGSRLILGEMALDRDPTRSYAILTRPGGRLTVVPGGEPDRMSDLPVKVKLPDGQGWAVASRGAQLDYRLSGGSWKGLRTNALLVPAAAVQVRVRLNGDQQVVPLH